MANIILRLVSIVVGGIGKLSFQYLTRNWALLAVILLALVCLVPNSSSVFAQNTIEPSASSVNPKQNVGKFWYQIQRGDTLGAILFGLEIGPLWGTRGFVKKTIFMNQESFDERGDFLVDPGAWIQVPFPPNWKGNPNFDNLVEAGIVRTLDSGSVTEIEESDNPAKTEEIGSEEQPVVSVEEPINEPVSQVELTNHPQELTEPTPLPEVKPSSSVPQQLGGEFWYQIQRGDTLGSILHALEVSPLWGPQGHVKKAIAMNPIALTKQGDFLVEPGQWLRLPFSPRWQENDRYQELVSRGLIQNQIPEAVIDAPVAPVNKQAQVNDIDSDSKLEIPNPLLAQVLEEPPKIDFESESAVVEKIAPPPALAKENLQERSPSSAGRSPHEFWYQVQRGDTLGSILHNLEIGPLWGPQGHVKKAILMNPGSLDGRGDFLVEPGAWIRLPISPNWQGSGKYEELQATGEIQTQIPDEILDIPPPRPRLEDLVPETLAADESSPATEEAVSEPEGFVESDVQSVEAPTTLPEKEVLLPEPEVQKTPVAQGPHEFWYQLQRGDTLGTILQGFGISPIWGDTGYVKKAIQMNSTSISEAGDFLIEPGEWLRLPLPPGWKPNARFRGLSETGKVQMNIPVAAIDLPQPQPSPDPGPEPNEPTELVNPSIPPAADQSLAEEPLQDVLKEPEGPPGPPEFWYQVQEGDTLSDVFASFRVHPRWGPNGYIAAAIKMNPGSLSEEGLITSMPGSWLRLPLPPRWKSNEKFQSRQKLGLVRMMIPEELLDLPSEKDRAKLAKEEELNQLESKSEEEVRANVGAEVEAEVEARANAGAEVEARANAGAEVEVEARADAETEVEAEAKLQGEVFSPEPGSLDLSSPTPENAPEDLSQTREVASSALEAAPGDEKIEKNMAQKILDSGISYFYYQVQKNDGLGDILFGMEISPLWGRRGHVFKTVHLNGGLITPNHQLPRIGTWIKVPKPHRWKPPKKFFDLADQGLVMSTFSEVQDKVDVSLQQPIDLLSNPGAEAQAPSKVPEGTDEILYHVWVEPNENNYFWYKLQKGDSLGAILSRFQIRPIYGLGGYLDEVMELNPKKVYDNGNIVEPNFWLKIPYPRNKTWRFPVSMTTQKLTIQEIERLIVGQMIPMEKEGELVIAEAPPDTPNVNKATADDLTPVEVLEAAQRICSSSKGKKPDTEMEERIEEMCLSFFVEPGKNQRLPAAVEVLSKENIDRDWGIFTAKPGVFATRLSAEDTTEGASAVIAAESHMSAAFGWRRRLTNNTSIMLGLSYDLVTYSQPSGFQFSEPEKGHLAYSLGVRYNFSEKLALIFNGGIEDRVLLESITQTAVTVSKVSLPYGQVSVRYEGINYGPLSVSVEGGARMMMGGSGETVTVDGGVGIYALADQRVVLDKKNILGGALILQWDQIKTSNSVNSIYTTGGRVFWIYKP